MINEVWQGDCLELMKNIPDKSIDMIFCDLPYGITHFEWDKPLDLYYLWSHYKRIIKSKGAIVLTASQPFSSQLVISNPKWFRVEWIWEKNITTNFLNCNKHPLKAHESVLVFAQSQTIYNPIFIPGVPSSRKNLRREHDKTWKNKGVKNKNYINPTGSRYPRTIQKFNVDRGIFHRTQKPVSLCEYFIKTYSNPGDLILDNCAGSGTTAIAAINTQRNYLMIEREKEFIDIINTRINLKAEIKEFINGK